MAEFEEKKYSIDPGPGKKMDGCPYSNYEDGHDIKDYIIPPKGYVFTGFRFDPDAKNQIYDGKLYALYTKEPFKIRMKSNMWKVMLAVIIAAIIGLVVLLANSIFKEPKSQTSNTSKEPNTEVTTKPTKELEKTDNSLSRTTKRNKKSKKEKREKEKKEKQEKKNRKESNKDNKDNNEIVQQEKEPVVEPQEPVTQPQEPVQPAVIDPNEQFKQEFWYLIHQRNPSMDAYHDLYTNNKGNVKGEEFDYLRFTILKDYATFKEWYDKLRLIPEKQLSSITSINELINKLG